MALVVVAKLVVAVAPPTGPPARHRQDDCCSPFRDASNGSQKVWASCKSDTLFLHRRTHSNLGRYRYAASMDLAHFPIDDHVCRYQRLYCDTPSIVAAGTRVLACLWAELQGFL